METKLLNEITGLEQLEEKINQFIEEEILNVKETMILEKWNYFPVLSLKDEQTISKFLEVVKYIDELSVSNEKKIQYILTLVYLVLELKLDILTMDINNVFLLTAYSNELNLESIMPSLNYLNNDTLLQKIRFKTLDIDIRLKLMKYMDTNKKSIEEAIKWIDETEYYELLKTVES